MSGLKLLGVLSLAEGHASRNILGDQRFSSVLGYLSARIMEEENLGVRKNNYATEMNNDIRILIEFLDDITSKSKRTKEKYITQKEFDHLCDSLLTSTVEPLNRVTNFSDIYNFLNVKKFGPFPDDLISRTLLFKAKKRFREDCEAVSIEFFKKNLRVDVIEADLHIDDTRGYVFDLIQEESSDIILFDNNITPIVETKKKKILSPMVKHCYENERGIAGILRNPRTTKLQDDITRKNELGTKSWQLPRFDVEILRYVLIPGAFTRIFRDVSQNIERQYLYFMPHYGDTIWRINNYHLKKNQNFSVLGDAIRDISMIPIVSRITNLIGPQTKGTWQEALLKSQMRWSVNLLRTRRLDQSPGDELDIEGELKSSELRKRMLKSSKKIKKSYDSE